MSRSLFNKATWVLLAAAVAVLNSADPGGNPCSIADLDGDCDVDLSDFAVFQAAFSGAGDYELVGEIWDVFYLHNVNEWLYSGQSFVFYRNGTVDINANAPSPSLYFYTFDGQQAAIDGVAVRGDGECAGAAPTVEMIVSFNGSDEMQGFSYCNGEPFEFLRLLRRY